VAEARILGKKKTQQEKQYRNPTRKKPKNVWESLQDVSNLYDLRPPGGSYILMVFLNI
jgi:hypothetical protein